MEKVGQFSPMIVHFCFYLMGIILIGGGSKKIYDNYQKLKHQNQD